MISIYRCPDCQMPHLTCNPDTTQHARHCVTCGGELALETKMPWDSTPTEAQRHGVNLHLAVTKPGAPVH